MTSDDRNDRNDTDESGFVRTVLSGLFETLADMDDRDQRRRHASGSARDGTTRFDYSFDVGIGPGEDAESGQRRIESETDYATTVQPVDGGYVVTVDLPDVDPDELAAGIDAESGRLVVADDDRVLERVSVPENGFAVADAAFNNGVLDVRLRPAGVDE